MHNAKPKFSVSYSPLTKIRILSLINNVTLVYPRIIFEHLSSIYVLLAVFCEALIKLLPYLHCLHNSCFKNFSVNFLSLRVIESHYKVWKDQTRVILPVESSSENPISFRWSSHSESVHTIYQRPVLHSRTYLKSLLLEMKHAPKSAQFDIRGEILALFLQILSRGRPSFDWLRTKFFSKKSRSDRVYCCGHSF